MWRRTTGWVGLSVLRRSIDAAGPPIPMGSLYVGAGLCSSIGASCVRVCARPSTRSCRSGAETICQRLASRLAAWVGGMAVAGEKGRKA